LRRQSDDPPNKNTRSISCGYFLLVFDYFQWVRVWQALEGMTPETLFAELLGVGLKWRVTKCLFHKDHSQADLQMEHTRRSLEAGTLSSNVARKPKVRPHVAVALAPS
jgi:hypothetical protein